MKLIVLLLLIFNFYPANSMGFKSWAKDFCERHLIADDPYQYDAVTTIHLVETYREYGARVYWRKNAEEQHYLITMGRALRGRLRWTKQWQLTEAERIAITEALEDYPSGG